MYVFNDEREKDLYTSTMVYRGGKKRRNNKKKIREYWKNSEDIEISENSVEEYFENIVGKIKEQKCKYLCGKFCREYQRYKDPLF